MRWDAASEGDEVFKDEDGADFCGGFCWGGAEEAFEDEGGLRETRFYGHGLTTFPGWPMAGVAGPKRRFLLGMTTREAEGTSRAATARDAADYIL